MSGTTEEVLIMRYPTEIKKPRSFWNGWLSMVEIVEEGREKKSVCQDDVSRHAMW